MVGGFFPSFFFFFFFLMVDVDRLGEQQWRDGGGKMELSELHFSRFFLERFMVHDV